MILQSLATLDFNNNGFYTAKLKINSLSHLKGSWMDDPVTLKEEVLMK